MANGLNDQLPSLVNRRNSKINNFGGNIMVMCTRNMLELAWNLTINRQRKHNVSLGVSGGREMNNFLGTLFVAINLLKD